MLCGDERMKGLMSQVQRIKRSQHLLLYTVIGVMSLVIIGLLGMMLDHSPSSPQHKAKSYKAPITSGASRLDPKEVWAEKFTSDHTMQAKRLDAMEKMLQTILKLNQAHKTEEAQQGFQEGSTSTASVKKTAFYPHSPEMNRTIGDSKNLLATNPSNDVAGLRQEVLQAEGELRHTPEFVITVGHQAGDQNADQKDNQGLNAQAQKPNAGNVLNPKATSPEKPRFRSKGIQRVSLSLLNAKKNKALKTFDNTIPAGAFAGAVMVGGVDASTSIQASNDPRPVLLRVTDPGTLPRKFKSDLCGCHVLAACYGDISSERVYMRLEKLTCTERQTGEIVEMTVNGYVAGEDGRAGLRGVVVDRAGESMRNAAVGGFLSGMGNFLSQSHSPVTFSPANGLAQTNPMTNPDMLKFGAAKGASGALERYADFYIKRAEQMQPVIQVQAGRRVDIVFTQGFTFEDSAARGAMIKVNDQQRLSQIQGQEASHKPLEVWIPNAESAHRNQE